MSTGPIRFPLDRTGLSPDNRVEGEVHTLVNRTVRAIAPAYGAFFAESIIVRDRTTGLTLTKGVQYTPTEMLEFPTGRFGKEIDSLILITDTTVSNDVEITYQALGGEYSANTDVILQLINNLELDARPVSWPDIINKPSGFVPAFHYHDAGDIYGFEYVVAAIDRLRSAVLLGDSASHDEIYRYIDAVLSGRTTSEIQTIDAGGSSYGFWRDKSTGYTKQWGYVRETVHGQGVMVHYPLKFDQLVKIDALSATNIAPSLVGNVDSMPSMRGDIIQKTISTEGFGFIAKGSGSAGFFWSAEGISTAETQQNLSPYDFVDYSEFNSNDQSNAGWGQGGLKGDSTDLYPLNGQTPPPAANNIPSYGAIFYTDEVKDVAGIGAWSGSQVIGDEIWERGQATRQEYDITEVETRDVSNLVIVTVLLGTQSDGITPLTGQITIAGNTPVPTSDGSWKVATDLPGKSVFVDWINPVDGMLVRDWRPVQAVVAKPGTFRAVLFNGSQVLNKSTLVSFRFGPTQRGYMAIHGGVPGSNLFDQYGGIIRQTKVRNIPGVNGQAQNAIVGTNVSRYTDSGIVSYPVADNAQGSYAIACSVTVQAGLGADNVMKTFQIQMLRNTPVPTLESGMVLAENLVNKHMKMQRLGPVSGLIESFWGLVTAVTLTDGNPQGGSETYVSINGAQAGTNSLMVLAPDNFPFLVYAAIQGQPITDDMLVYGGIPGPVMDNQTPIANMVANDPFWYRGVGVREATALSELFSGQFSGNIVRLTVQTDQVTSYIHARMHGKTIIQIKDGSWIRAENALNQLVFCDFLSSLTGTQARDWCQVVAVDQFPYTGTLYVLNKSQVENKATLIQCEESGSLLGINGRTAPAPVVYDVNEWGGVLDGQPLNDAGDEYLSTLDVGESLWSSGQYAREQRVVTDKILKGGIQNSWFIIRVQVGGSVAEKLPGNAAQKQLQFHMHRRTKIRTCDGQYVRAENALNKFVFIESNTGGTRSRHWAKVIQVTQNLPGSTDTRTYGQFNIGDMETRSTMTGGTNLSDNQYHADYVAVNNPGGVIQEDDFTYEWGGIPGDASMNTSGLLASAVSSGDSIKYRGAATMTNAVVSTLRREIFSYNGVAITVNVAGGKTIRLHSRTKVPILGGTWRRAAELAGNYIFVDGPTGRDWYLVTSVTADNVGRQYFQFNWADLEAKSTMVGSLQSPTTYFIGVNGPSDGDLVTTYEVVFNSSGYTSWTCPPGVTSVNCVVIGGGGDGIQYGGQVSGGGGGGLAWKNNIPTIPGQMYQWTIGEAGGRAGGITQTSMFGLVANLGQDGKQNAPSFGGDGAFGDGNFIGGGSSTNFGGTSPGGSAAGYNANGANNGNQGTGLYGTGSIDSYGRGGNSVYSGIPQDGFHGAIRVMWGPGKSFPNNATPYTTFDQYGGVPDNTPMIDTASGGTGFAGDFGVGSSGWSRGTDQRLAQSIASKSAANMTIAMVRLSIQLRGFDDLNGVVNEGTESVTFDMHPNTLLNVDTGGQVAASAAQGKYVFCDFVHPGTGVRTRRWCPVSTVTTLAAAPVNMNQFNTGSINTQALYVGTNTRSGVYLAINGASAADPSVTDATEEWGGLYLQTFMNDSGTTAGQLVNGNSIWARGSTARTAYPVASGTTTLNRLRGLVTMTVRVLDTYNQPSPIYLNRTITLSPKTKLRVQTGGYVRVYNSVGQYVFVDFVSSNNQRIRQWAQVTGIVAAPSIQTLRNFNAVDNAVKAYLAGFNEVSTSGSPSGSGYLSIQGPNEADPVLNFGEIEFTTPGTYNWTVPAGVTSVCVVCIGAGGAQYAGNSNNVGGGGGGALVYRNQIPVTPGQVIPIVVGAPGLFTTNGVPTAPAGGASSFNNSMTAGGGGGGSNLGGTINVGVGGTPSGTYSGGFSGGNGTFSNSPGILGGAAASYTANGANGGNTGMGINGTGSTGTYGKGDNTNIYASQNQVSNSGTGAVKVIWGTGRSYPNFYAGGETSEQTYLSPGTYNFSVPAGVTKLSVMGVGGGQGATTSQGGQGGCYAYRNGIPVTPGAAVTVTVGAGGSPGGNPGGQTRIQIPTSNVDIIIPGGSGSNVYGSGGDVNNRGGMGSYNVEATYWNPANTGQYNMGNGGGPFKDDYDYTNNSAPSGGGVNTGNLTLGGTTYVAFGHQTNDLITNDNKNLGGGGGYVTNMGTSTGAGDGRSGGVYFVWGGRTFPSCKVEGSIELSPGINPTNWTVPEGVTSISVVAIGAGGGFQIQAANAWAGGGGALAYKNNIPVTPGQQIPYQIDGNGAVTILGMVVGKGQQATIGSVGNGGTASGGDVNFSGGNGEFGASLGTVIGGSAASYTANGANGSAQNGTGSTGTSLSGIGVTGQYGKAAKLVNGAGVAQGPAGIRIIWGTGRTFPNNANMDRFGSVSYTVPGVYSFVVPDNVGIISAVVVGAGANGGGTTDRRGGGGGGLAYKRRIGVNPGDVLTIQVGAHGSAATVSSLSGTPSMIASGALDGFTANNGANAGQRGTASGGDVNFNGGQGISGVFQTMYGGSAGSYTSIGADGGGGGTSGRGTNLHGKPYGVISDNFGAGGSSDATTGSALGQDGGVRIIWGRDRFFPNSAGSDIQN